MIRRVAAVQMHPSTDIGDNLGRAISLVENARVDHVDLVALPEKFTYCGPEGGVGSAATEVPGPIVSELSRAAADAGVFLLAGSIIESSPKDRKIYNTSLLFDRKGQLIGKYRKIHLFDAFARSGSLVAHESALYACGDQVEVVRTEDFIIGMSICYDVRWPKLYWDMTDLGATMFTIPSAFRLHTGRDHWVPLLRARAIENQAYVIAPNVCGYYGTGKERFGRSIIVDPWGIVLAQAVDEECIIVADVRPERVSEVRTEIPMRTHRSKP